MMMWVVGIQNLVHPSFHMFVWRKYNHMVWFWDPTVKVGDFHTSSRTKWQDVRLSRELQDERKS